MDDQVDALLDALAGETILITGGAGFIGSTLAGYLLARSNVVVFDNFARDALSDTDYADSPNLRVLRGNVLDTESVRDAMRGATRVVHCAGITGIDTVVKRPVDTIRVNAIGSANVLQAAAELGTIRRVTCFSTSEVFGQLAFRSEETSPAVLGAAGEARWTYAVSKLTEEHLAYAYFRQHQLPTVSVRPFNVYGPGQVGEGAMRTFIMRALEGEDLTIHGEGTQIRAWCYIDDMVDGILRTLVLDAAVGQSFNIGNQRAVVSVYGLASTIVRVLESSSKIRFVPRPSADIDLRIPSIDKARDVLGFEARVDLEDGIQRTAKYFMAHHL